MPLPKRKLEEYCAYYGCTVAQVREFRFFRFFVIPHHVVFTREHHAQSDGPGNSWNALRCRCDFAWKRERTGDDDNKHELVHVGDALACSFKERARNQVMREVREQRRALWSTLTLTGKIADVFAQVQGGKYVGEYNVGILYVQDVEKLLEIEPRTEVVPLANHKPVTCSFPSRETLRAIDELRAQKVLDLSGMILVPYHESFCFPDQLHDAIAQIIEEPLGWPNGDVGDIFLFELYKKIALQTGWESGGAVFGDEHMPKLSNELALRIPQWLYQLDPKLVFGEVTDVSGMAQCLESVTTERWVEWLVSLRREILGEQEE